MRYTAPNNHNYYEEAPLSDPDLKEAFGANKSFVKRKVFSSLFELNTKSESLEQVELFKFKPTKNRLDDEAELILKLYAKQVESDEVRYFVQTGLFSGVVYYNSCQFNITTRYGKSFLNRMLNYVNDVYIDNEDALVSESDQKNEFQNIIAYLFIQSLERAAVLGLPKNYKPLSQRSSKVRGKIDINNFIKSNIPFTGKLTTSYREQLYIQEIIDVLYACCRHLEKSYGNTIRRKLLGVYQSLKENYSGIYPGPAIINRAMNHIVLNNPIYEAYKKVLRYAQIIINERSLRPDTDSSVITKGYLFDISQLFEVYLERLLTRHFKDWFVTGQEELIVYNNAFYKRRMYPDIIMRHKYSDAIIALDAKFKNMEFESRDLDRSDFYQIHSYIQYYQHNVLFGGLIYPFKRDFNSVKSHSDHLFGNNNKTGFIVDGIEVNESMSMNQIIQSENKFLDRLDLLIDQKLTLINNSKIIQSA